MSVALRMRRLFPALVAAALLATPAALLAQASEERAFLLVAHPALADPNFARTVVVAVRDDDGGPLGVILNRPTDVPLGSLYPDRPDVAGRKDAIFFGGPVQPDALLFAFRSATRPPQGMRVAEDIYLSGYSGVLEELLRHPEHAAEQRFFIGYSGWATGQLEAEIEQGGWYVLPLDTSAIFRMDPHTMYEELLARARAPRIEASYEVGPLPSRMN
jgi:putative transcriptional regulator